MKQELLTLPGHLSSPQFLVGLVLLDLQCVMFCRSLFCLGFFSRCTLSVFYVWLLITPLVSSNVFVNYCDYNVFTHQLHLLLIYLLIYGFISSLRNFVNVFSLIFSDPIRSFIHPEWSQIDYLNKILFNLNRNIIYYRKYIWTKEIISNFYIML